MGGRRKLPPVPLRLAARIYAISEDELLKRQARQTRSRAKKNGAVPLEAVAVKLLEWYQNQDAMLAAAREQAARETEVHLRAEYTRAITELLGRWRSGQTKVTTPVAGASGAGPQRQGSGATD